MPEKIPPSEENEVLLDTEVIGQALNEMTQPDKVSETSSLLALGDHIEESKLSIEEVEKMINLINKTIENKNSTEAKQLWQILANMIGKMMPDFQ